MDRSPTEQTPLIYNHTNRMSQTDTVMENGTNPSGNTVDTYQGSKVDTRSTVSKSRFSLSSWLDGVSAPVYILIMLFAWSSWIDINGLWVEVPLLVNELPESWNLPSYIIMLIQFANVGPLLYTVLVNRWPRKIKEWPVVYVIITIGALSCLALVFFWDYTSVINGAEHSTGLLTLTFFLALVDCTSSVVYLPYMAMFKPQYMTSFYIGEGLSGLIPGLVGLIQGVGGDPECVNSSRIIQNETTGINETEWVIIPVYKEPNFSIEVFFFFLFCMILVSAFAFTCIHFMPFAKRERVDPIGVYIVAPPDDQGNAYYNKPGDEDNVADGTYQVVYTDGMEQPNQGVEPNQMEQPKQKHENQHCDNGVIEDGAVESSSQKLTESNLSSQPSLTRGQFIYLLIVTAWINGLTNGVLPSTQSYTCLPYGGLAYTLTVRLSTVANPLACFCALFVPLQSITTVTVLVVLGSTLSVYQLVLAGLSPEPPLQGEVIGEILVVMSAVLLTAFFSFCKVTIASILRDEGGRTSLIWCGAVTQIGSFIGAIVIFLIVSVFKLLESMPPCPI